MLAQENNAALLAASHIGAQVQFREVDIAGPAHAEHARVTKVEGDQADKGVAVKEVKLQSARNVPQQQTGRDGKRKNAKVDPARGHEGTHACLRRERSIFKSDGSTGRNGQTKQQQVQRRLKFSLLP